MITSHDYTGTLCILIHADTGAPVTAGDTVADFRSERATITGGRAPHHEASTGRVYVTAAGGGFREYFPGVFGLAWRAAAVAE